VTHDPFGDDFDEDAESDDSYGDVSDEVAASDDDFDDPIFAVTNPRGTVTVSALLNGRIDSVELDPHVTQMTEAELMDEIRVLADLARQKARAAMHLLTMSYVRAMGHDDALFGDVLVRELDMPTPEAAAAAQAEVFATRYAE
jgi:hypothetical protein